MKTCLRKYLHKSKNLKYKKYFKYDKKIII